MSCPVQCVVPAAFYQPRALSTKHGRFLPGLFAAGLSTLWREHRGAIPGNVSALVCSAAQPAWGRQSGGAVTVGENWTYCHIRDIAYCDTSATPRHRRKSLRTQSGLTSLLHGQRGDGDGSMD